MGQSRRAGRWLKASVRRLRDRALDTFEKLMVRIGRKTKQTIRGSVFATQASQTAHAGGIVIQAPIQLRLENLEKWQQVVTADSKLEARFLIWGFLLIAAGEGIDWWLC